MIITARLIAIATIAILTIILVKEGSLEKANLRAMKYGRFRNLLLCYYSIIYILHGISLIFQYKNGIKSTDLYNVKCNFLSTHILNF